MARLPRWLSLGLLVTLPLLLVLMLRRPDSEPVPSRPETPAAGGSPSEIGAPVPGRGQALNDVALTPDAGAPERPETPPGPEGAPSLSEPAGLPAYPLPEAIRWPSTPEAEAEIRAMLDLVADAIRSEKFVEMKAIIDAIKAHGTAAYGPLLEVLRQSDDSRLPIYAAVILAEMEVEHPDTELATALRDSALPRLESLAMAGDDPALRHAALVALGKVGDPGSFDLLVDALARENGGVLGEQAARSLTGLRGAEMTDALAALAREEPDPALRQSLTDALAAREDPASLETLESLARRDYSDEVRLAAIRGLAALPGAEADELLRDIARSPENADLRAAALTGLGISGDKRDLDLMEDALRFSSSNQVRTAAYRGLARIGTPDARRVMEDYRPAARIDQVFRGSNAEASGLLSEDIVTKYDGMAVEGALELKALARGTQPNRSVRLQVLRDGRTFSMSVTGGFLGVAIEDGVARN